MIIPVQPGDVVRLVGKRRGRYRVVALEGNPVTGAMWLKVFGGPPGRAGYRHVRLDQVRLVGDQR